MTPSRTRAIVLRRTNYGEADRIIQIITPDGRRSVIARGVRKEKSRLAGGIELFALSDIVLTKGRGDLDILTSARLVQFYRHILEDYDRMQFAYEVLKHVARVSDSVDEPEWFDVLHEALQALDSLKTDLDLIKLWFYVRYSKLLGHELSLHYDSEGEPLTSDNKYQYDISEKSFRVSQNGEINADHIKFLRLVSTKSIKVLEQIGGVGEITPVCLSVARSHAAL